MLTTAALITPERIDELSPALFRVAMRMVRSHADAEDLVQDTWFSALRSAHTFAGRSSLQTWLAGIMRRRLADRYRRQRLTEPYVDEYTAAPPTSPSEQLDVRAAAEHASAALATLTDLERAAVVLCDVEDLERGEAADRIGVTRGHLRVLLHRARQKLELALGRAGIDEHALDVACAVS